MKDTLLKCSILLIVAHGTAHATTTAAFDTLQAGTGNTFVGWNTSATAMFAVGTNNLIGMWGSAAVGDSNEVRTAAGLAVGTWNHVGQEYRDTRGSMAIGNQNYVACDYTLAVGSFNWSLTDTEFGGGTNSLVVGAFNSNWGDSSLLIGLNNNVAAVDDGSTVHMPQCSILLGSGLISRHDNCTVVGKNNVSVIPTIPPSTPSPLFVVGNGSSASNRSNAFEVRDNGDIIISKPQGDISMGIYGN